MSLTKVWMGHSEAKIAPIQWADVDHKQVVGFLVRCPHCMHQQWARVDELYIAFDGTTTNLKCKKCGTCKVRPGDRRRREVSINSLFSPAPTGWRSISNNYAIPEEPDTPPELD